jgi:hypothetical protein
MAYATVIMRTMKAKRRQEEAVAMRILAEAFQRLFMRIPGLDRAKY